MSSEETQLKKEKNQSWVIFECRPFSVNQQGFGSDKIYPADKDPPKKLSKLKCQSEDLSQRF